MLSYTDLAGRLWFCDLNFETVERLRAAHGIDILDVVDEAAAPKLWARLQWPRTLVEVLWTLNESTAASRGVGRKDFDAGHGGDVWDAAAAALDEAITGFFPQRLRSLIRAATEARTLAEREAAEAYRAILASPECRERLREEIAANAATVRAALRSAPTTFDPSFTNSPESSACGLVPGPCEALQSPLDNDELRNGTAPLESAGPC